MNLTEKKAIFIKSKTDDLGFALPLALATLLILSMIAVFLTERILTAQALAHSDTARVNRALEFHIIEQDLIWRALLEAYGVETGNLLSEKDKRIYIAETPISPWIRNGTSHIWTGNYPDPAIDINPDKNFKIEIRDVRGLIDINYANREYIRFIAEKFEVPSGQRDRAIESLYTEIIKRNESVEDPSGVLNVPLFKGLHDVTEICTMDGWTASAICQTEDFLRRVAYAGLGGLPNITLASPEVTKLLLEDEATTDPKQNSKLWRALQQKHGFANIFLSAGEGYQSYYVTAFFPESHPQQYLLDVRIQPDKRPYRIYRIQPNL